MSNITTINYQIRTDGDEMYATFSRPNLYVEVPITTATTEDEIEDLIHDFLLQVAQNQTDPSKLIEDDVYVDGSVVRRDYSVGTPEGQALVAELEEAFPNFVNWESTQYNLVGRFSAYREPYENTSISWYVEDVTPSAELLSDYGIEEGSLNLISWYGLKFDMSTRDIKLKAVVVDVEGDKPALPAGYNGYYALTYNQDHSLSEWVDFYVTATAKRMVEFCAENGLDYPAPAVGTDVEDDEFIDCWGVVYNSRTLEYGPVKAYVRRELDA